jgi:hypothetical protein
LDGFELRHEARRYCARSAIAFWFSTEFPVAEDFIATKKQRHAMRLYANLMEEAKLRLSALEHASNGRTGLIAPLAREFCYLQLRMLCEVIALGCLTAHGDIAGLGSKKFRKEHSADRLIKMLSDLHPNFYPVPHNKVDLAPGRFHLDTVTEEYFTRDALLRLYGSCGDVLHRER